jgi:hypothetical protein
MATGTTVVRVEPGRIVCFNYIVELEPEAVNGG